MPVPRSPQDIAAELDRARAAGERPRVRPSEVTRLLDVVLERTRASAERSARELTAAARAISRSRPGTLKRVGT